MAVTKHSFNRSEAAIKEIQSDSPLPDEDKELSIVNLRTRVVELSRTINQIDAISQCINSQIGSLAMIVKDRATKRGEAQLADALEVIAYLADTLGNNINGEAEAVGCNHT